MEILECPVCYGEVGIVGVLGWRVHCQCRHCGIEFSKDLKEMDETEREDILEALQNND